MHRVRALFSIRTPSGGTFRVLPGAGKILKNDYIRCH